MGRHCSFYMKQIFYFIIVCLLAFSSHGFAQQSSRLAKYAGKYSYGKDSDEGHGGTILIHPDTDSTFLFFLRVNKGVPSYNTGELYGRLKIKFGIGLFYAKSNADSKGCKLLFRISESKLEIETLEECNECGFDRGVYADGNYVHGDRKKPEYFIDFKKTKIYFNKTKPEEYYNK